jgi:hypothetical protein
MGDSVLIGYLYYHVTDGMDADPFGRLPLTDADKEAGWRELPLYVDKATADKVPGLRRPL